MTEPTVYIGKDLEAMSITVNYQRWIIDGFKPFIGKNIVEVGAGTGTISALLLASSPETLSLVEPSGMFEQLVKNVGDGHQNTTVDFYNAVYTDVSKKIGEKQLPDTLVYVNVLEHIEDDVAELKAMRESLAIGGHALMFVPALTALYSEFDRMIGHYRRYTKKELEEKCRLAGFEIVRSRYFDFAGILPWFVKFKIFGSRYLNAKAVKAYDRVAIPFVRRIESVVSPPIGKNILIVARRTS